jgi:hypothetical protein
MILFEMRPSVKPFILTSIVILMTTVLQNSKSLHACEVEVIYPHSATTFYIGGQHTINIYPDTCSTDVRLDLYKSDQFLCTIADISGIWYEWYVANACNGGAGTDYQIKATCLADTTCYDFSAYFTIEGTEIDCEFQVNIPDSTTTYYIGGQYMINVSPNNCSYDIRLDLYKSDLFLCTITNRGYSWTLWNGVSTCGGEPGNDYQIKATCIGYPICHDFSDYFTIESGNRPIILSPSEGESFYSGSAIDYCWMPPVDIEPISGYELQFCYSQSPDGPWDSERFIEETCWHTVHEGVYSSLYWRVRIVFANGDRGPWSVSYHNVIEGDDPPLTGMYWDVIKTGEDGDTLFVQIQLSENESCGDSYCGYTRSSTLSISPCPADVTYPCVQYTLEDDSYMITQLKLLKGVAYTIGGTWSHHGHVWATGVECGGDCYMGGRLTTVAYPSDFTATSTNSWGAIKLFYKK